MTQETVRYYVRGGLDPAYRTEEGLDSLVRHLLRLPNYSAGDRALMAAAAIQGWCTHHHNRRSTA